MKQINNIGIVLKPNVTTEFSNLIPNLITWLVRRKKNIIFLDTELTRVNKLLRNLSQKEIEHIQFVEDSNLFACSDLIISLGGDGTLIGTTRKTQGQKCPIFGVNLGHLGFITEFNKKNIYEDLDDIFKGNFDVSTYNMFKAEIFRKSEHLKKEIFFNDAVITKQGIARIFKISLEIDNEPVYTMAGDGIIVSTPIGSTAYSLAAGGPIVHPSVKSCVITPICPHGLTHRPLVLTDKSEIKLRLADKDESANLTLDGQVVIEVTYEDIIIISKDPKNKIYLINNTERTYFHTLQDKFVHGKR